ncbi:MAG: hypothetical protein HQK95_05910 [Nitrospirae bacterium]|nr:hypothetical protein [Nitrospirota bacterium]
MEISKSKAATLRANAIERYNRKFLSWIPAFAGMTNKAEQINPLTTASTLEASAGMTNKAEQINTLIRHSRSHFFVIPVSFFVIPAKAGIQRTSYQSQLYSQFLLYFSNAFALQPHYNDRAIILGCK